MPFDARGGISILELVVYFPLLILAAIICKRHGFGRSSGWIFTLLLCFVRLLGACCQLATYQHPSTGLFEAVVILNSVGLSPLLLATLGLLTGCVDSIKESRSSPFRSYHFRLLQTLIVVGLILSIVGGTNSFSKSGIRTVSSLSKAGIILYIIAYAAEVLIAVHTFMLFSAAGYGKGLLIAVLAALPFILVRLIYSALGVIAHLHTFSSFNGSLAAFAIMAVVTEIAVIFLYLYAGWRAPARSRNSPPNLA